MRLPRAADPGRVAAYSFLGLIAIGMACTDVPSYPPATAVDAEMTPVGDTAAHPRARLESRLQHSWVGKAHNKIFEDFRRDLARPGLLTSDLCAYTLSVITENGRLERSGAPRGAKGSREAALAAKGRSGLCSQISHDVRNAKVVLGELQQESDVISTAGWELLNQLPFHVEAAVDANDLATRLNGVLDASSGMTETEKEVIEAAVATSQYSFEYWSSQLAPFEEAFWSEYSQCASAAYAAGEDSESARLRCTESEARAVVIPSAPRGHFFAASYSPQWVCGLPNHFKKLVGADVVGAMVGAVKGLKVLGGSGALVGAVSGGAFGSMSSFLVSTWSIFWCAMD